MAFKLNVNEGAARVVRYWLNNMILNASAPNLAGHRNYKFQLERSESQRNNIALLVHAMAGA